HAGDPVDAVPVAPAAADAGRHPHLAHGASRRHVEGEARIGLRAYVPGRRRARAVRIFHRARTHQRQDRAVGPSDGVGEKASRRMKEAVKLITLQKTRPPSFEEAQNRRQKARAAGMNPDYWYPAAWDKELTKGKLQEVTFWKQS